MSSMAAATQQTYDLIITSSLRQNDVAMSFWSYNDLIITPCVPQYRQSNQSNLGTQWAIPWSSQWCLFWLVLMGKLPYDTITIIYDQLTGVCILTNTVSIYVLRVQKNSMWLLDHMWPRLRPQSNIPLGLDNWYLSNGYSVVPLVLAIFT